jgi:hypothetical protein
MVQVRFALIVHAQHLKPLLRLQTILFSIDISVQDIGNGFIFFLSGGPAKCKNYGSCYVQATTPFMGYITGSSA